MFKDASSIYWYPYNFKHSMLNENAYAKDMTTFKGKYD